jgi:multiple sugar transport system substrate-binding protein
MNETKIPAWKRLTPNSRPIGAALFLLAILFGGILASCGPAASDATPHPPAGPTATLTVPVELPRTIAIRGRFSPEVLDILDQQIMAFQEENPDIRVAVLRAPGGSARQYEAFSQQLRSGDTSPDIYVLDPTWLAEFYAAGWLAQLDRYAAQHAIEIEEFFPPAAEASSLEGKLVALPLFLDGGLLYYRQDLFQKYGYEPPLDWLELQRIALEIKAGEGLPGGFVWQGAPYESLTCNALEYIWAYGGQVLDARGNPTFDTAKTRAGLQQMVDLVDLGASPPEVAGYAEGETLADFQDGDAAMMRHWASVWPYLEGSDSQITDQVGIAPLHVSCLGGLYLGLSAHSPYPEQAFRFMAFLVSPTQQLQFALEADQLPAFDPVYQDTRLMTDKPVLRELRDALQPARTRPRSPVYAEITETIYAEVNAMLRGSQDVAATASNIQHRLELAIR